jgi:hypothetical protein
MPGATANLVTQKESPLFTWDEEWGAWVAGVDTMGLVPRC